MNPEYLLSCSFSCQPMHRLPLGWWESQVLRIGLQHEDDAKIPLRGSRFPWLVCCWCLFSLDPCSVLCILLIFFSFCSSSMLSLILFPLHFQHATFISTALFDHPKDTSMVRFCVLWAWPVTTLPVLLKIHKMWDSIASASSCVWFSCYWAKPGKYSIHACLLLFCFVKKAQLIEKV